MRQPANAVTGVFCVLEGTVVQLEQRHEPQLGLLMRMVQTILAWINSLLELIRKDYQAAESLLNACIGAWAIVFFWNEYLGINMFAASRLYDPMAIRGTQVQWGFFALFLIVWWVVAVASQNATLRVIGQIFVIRWYSYLMLVFREADQLTFVAVMHTIGFGFSVWVLWRYCGRKRDPKP